MDASNKPQARRWQFRRMLATLLRMAAFYALPVITAISRASRCAHWPSDTIIGGTIGLVVAECVFVVLVGELQRVKATDEAALQEDPVASTSRVLPS
jgi:membrane-associated PAP2 superfamily phosphatase